MSDYELRIGDKTRIAEWDNGDYQWSIYAVFVDDAGRLFSTTDAGCSCSYPYQDEQMLEWTPLESVHHAIREARAWIGAEAKDIEDIEDIVSDLMAYRKPPTRPEGAESEQGR